MKLTVQHQESNSRGELLLRTFFGGFYILLPHGLAMIFPSIWAAILGFLAFWVVLFTGSYPKGWFEYQVKLMKWSLRINARFLNLVDGYPAFGKDGTDDKTNIEVDYPEELSRGTLLLRAFFGIFYCYLPHGFLLFFKAIWIAIQGFIAFWVVLFTGTFPESFHESIVGYFRWTTRLSLYMGNMTDVYPPFNGKE
ncbi:MAG: hypothetical protein A2Z99_21530 [Treponema sp. GWB1_62_6]|nr:MAG: hypothetical protein A2Y36_14780 [Treponema sp. GWA1_62_8]OHE64706.1 MAG: hypothetical protein A2001_04100 [Treponema sp. GWC1_61_84]OHE67732.1 MAG: hypothetical protein A2Z99_21530 [Treponema sp. GWB1_62_6]OHE75614.1 MAG: hypothetical protein A2413_11085 [Treponema sp. RIFOXYC1_FULL_61_9]HCM27540.1 hypothetical protein [Treponema sp.]